MVEPQPSKLLARVRFSLPAPLPSNKHPLGQLHHLLVEIDAVGAVRVGVGAEFGALAVHGRRTGCADHLECLRARRMCYIGTAAEVHEDDCPTNPRAGVYRLHRWLRGQRFDCAMQIKESRRQEV